MKPGRELDELVAEKVMFTPTNILKEWAISRKHHSVLITRFDRLPHYSTDISAAEEVIDKVKQPRRRIIMETLWGKYDGYPDGYKEGFQVNIMVDDGSWARGEAETLPHAICLAALKWVGE